MSRRLENSLRKPTDWLWLTTRVPTCGVRSKSPDLTSEPIALRMVSRLTLYVLASSISGGMMLPTVQWPEATMRASVLAVFSQSFSGFLISPSFNKSLL